MNRLGDMEIDSETWKPTRVSQSFDIWYHALIIVTYAGSPSENGPQHWLPLEPYEKLALR